MTSPARPITRLFAAAIPVLAAAVAQASPRPSDPAAAGGSAIRYTVPLSTVAAALTADGLAVTPGQIALSVPLTATTPSPHFHIAAVDPRPDGALHLRIVCRSSVECLPFFATVTPADGTDLLAALATRQTDSRAAATLLRQHPAGVSTGARITLELTDTQMRIHLPAIAIDTGIPGAEVRVASLDRKQTWRGVVVDSSTVKGGLQ